MLRKPSYLLFFFSSLITMVWFFSCKEDKTYPTTIEAISSKDSLATNSFDMSYFTTVNGAYSVPWPLLMRVKFEEKYDEKMGMEVALPIFSDTLKALDGKMVEVEGFYIPVSETGDDNIVILSAFPFAQCFFCGKAGVESIIDILSPKKLPLMKVDAKIKFRGRLKLNRDNFDYLIYVLEEAQLVE